jgi:hypothetical protein
VIHAPQAYRAISRKGKLAAHRRKSLHSPVSAWTAIYNLVDTDQLSRTQCVICATALGNEAMNPSKLIRHLNTKYSELVNKHIEFLLYKRDALKIEKKIISQASTTDTSLLTVNMQQFVIILL